jgi:hypothetical protein
MGEAEPTISDVESIFGRIMEKAKTAHESCRDNIYNFIHVFFAILLTVKDGSSVADITMPDGSPAFDAQQIIQVEGLLSNARPHIQELLGFETIGEQKGGGILDAAKSKLGGDSAGLAASILQTASEYVDPDKISVDALFTNLTGYLDRLDLQNRQIARLIGPVAFTSELKQDPAIRNPLFPKIPIDKIRIPARSIIPFINTIAEIVRILIALSPIQFPLIRSFMSLGLAMFDVMNGEWKNGVLSLLGIFGNKPMYIGIFLKVVHNAWLLIEPQLAKQLRLNIFKAGKSMTVGFLLWAFATFSFDIIRNPIEAGVGRLRGLVDRVNEKMEMLEQQANASAGPLGIQIIMPTIPTEMIPSFADIQNLQTILAQPEIYCNAEIRAVLEPMRYVPPLRFIMEMLNIPMVPELVADACKGIDPNNLSGSLAKKLQPQILVNGIPLTGAPPPSEPYPPKKEIVERGMANARAIGDQQGLDGLKNLTRQGPAAMQALTGVSLPSATAP